MNKDPSYFMYVATDPFWRNNFDVLFIALILEHFKECAKFGVVGKPEPSGILQRKKLGKKKN